MKKINYRKILLLSLGVATISLAGCGNNTTNTNKNISDSNSIQDVEGPTTHIQGNGKLTIEQKKQQEKKRQEEEKKAMEKFKNETNKKFDELIKKIKKEKDISNYINDIENIKYNKHLLSKDKQKKLDELIKYVKKKLINDAFATIKGSKLDINTKKKIVDILKKNKNEDLYKLINISKQVKTFVNIDKKPGGNKTFVENKVKYIKENISNISKQNLSVIYKKVDNILADTNSLFKETKVKTNNIDTDKVLGYIKSLIIQTKKENKLAKRALPKNAILLNNNDFISIVKLATSGKNIKTFETSVIRDDYIGKATILYVEYKGKKIDVSNIDNVYKQYKKYINLNITPKIILDKLFASKNIYTLYILQDNDELVKLVKAYNLVKQNPKLLYLVQNLYGVNNIEDVAQRLIDLVNGTYIDYSNVKDYTKFNQLIDILRE